MESCSVLGQKKKKKARGILLSILEKIQRRARAWYPAQYWGNEMVKEAVAVLAPVDLMLCSQFGGQGSIERVHQVQKRIHTKKRNTQRAKTTAAYAAYMKVACYLKQGSQNKKKLYKRDERKIKQRRTRSALLAQARGG